jgi:hypothetical protein
VPVPDRLQAGRHGRTVVAGPGLGLNKVVHAVITQATVPVSDLEVRPLGSSDLGHGPGPPAAMAGTVPVRLAPVAVMHETLHLSAPFLQAWSVDAAISAWFLST